MRGGTTDDTQGARVASDAGQVGTGPMTVSIQDPRWSTVEELKELEKHFKPPYIWVKVWLGDHVYFYGPFFTMDLAEEFATDPKHHDVVIVEFGGDGYPPPGASNRV